MTHVAVLVLKLEAESQDMTLRDICRPTGLLAVAPHLLQKTAHTLEVTVMLYGGAMALVVASPVSTNTAQHRV
jgi:hypothetical protein